MDSWNQSDALLIVIGSQSFILLLCLIWIAMLSSKMRKWRELFQQLQPENTKENLVSVLERLFDRINRLEESDESLEARINGMTEAVRKQKGNVGIVRFNAFSNEGSDLSFSIAIVDNEETGLVLTSIYGRDESRVYAKPLEKGISKYNLTEEEKIAIQEARKVLS